MDGVEALLFDVFGTVVDWRNSTEQELRELKREHNLGGAPGWESEFADEWRAGYIHTTRDVAAGNSGPFSVDQMHREV